MVHTLGLKKVFLCKYKSLNIPTILHLRHTKAEREVLVDSRATDNFISEKLLDDTQNKAGSIKEYVDL